MNADLPVDHDFVANLTHAGMPEAQAEVIARYQAKMVNTQLATKRDLKGVEVALTRDIKEVRVALTRDIKDVEVALRHDLEKVETALKRDIKDLKRDLLLSIGTMLGLAIAANTLVAKVLG